MLEEDLEKKEDEEADLKSPSIQSIRGCLLSLQVKLLCWSETEHNELKFELGWP